MSIKVGWAGLIMQISREVATAAAAVRVIMRPLVDELTGGLTDYD